MFSAINLVEREPGEISQKIKNSIIKSAKSHIPLQEKKKRTNGH